MAQPEGLREPVLNALAAGGHQMLVSMLEGGDWRVEGNELVIKGSASATVIDMTFGADARRLAIATASGAAGAGGSAAGGMRRAAGGCETFR